MRKIIPLLLALILVFFVSCTIDYLNTYEFVSNPFLEKTWIDDSAMDDKTSISFSMITDTHFGRDKSTWYNEKYFSALAERNYPFVLHLGDFTDTGVITENDKAFIEKVKSLTSEKFVTIAIGNHDRHNYSSIWNSTEGGDTYTTAGCYYYGKLGDKPLLAIYKIDTTGDSVGYKQFEDLGEALKRETAIYRMIIAHENVSIGNNLSPSLFIFGLSSEESNRLYRIMSENNVGLIMTGHNHLGNLAYNLSSNLGELNAAAYHRKETPVVQYESMGYWYDITLDTTNGNVVINAYLSETNEKYTSFNFTLPKV